MRRVTDPRDKVFAVLNFASEAMISDQRRTIINYDSPVKLVYLQATELWYDGGDLPDDLKGQHFVGHSHRSISFLDHMVNLGENEAAWATLVGTQLEHPTQRTHHRRGYSWGRQLHRAESSSSLRHPSFLPHRSPHRPWHPPALDLRGLPRRLGHL